ncbi:hypothetical protein RDWZM_008157, partial [Blomia tropicalis]
WCSNRIVSYYQKNIANIQTFDHHIIGVPVCLTCVCISIIIIIVHISADGQRLIWFDIGRTNNGKTR